MAKAATKEKSKEGEAKAKSKAEAKAGKAEKEPKVRKAGCWNCNSTNLVSKTESGHTFLSCSDCNASQ